MKTKTLIQFTAPAPIGGIAYGVAKLKDGQRAVVGYKVHEYIVTDTAVLAKTTSVETGKEQIINTAYLLPNATDAERLADSYEAQERRRRTDG